MNKSRILLIFTSLILLILFIWCASLLKCEILTAMYSKYFNERDVIDLLGDVQNCKVIDYSENEAKVYYVSEGKTMGNLLTFTKKNDTWKNKNWNTVWSKDGNADDIIWPYWWHFIYSH